MIQPTSFDERDVRYEYIHSISPDDFLSFVKVAQIEGNCRVLDCGCGYGAVSREILGATEQARSIGSTELTIDLIDESAFQLGRAEKELSSWMSGPGIKLIFIHGSFPDDLPMPRTDLYDVIACKMVLHEVCRDQQLAFVDEAFKCLKPGGRLVLWDLCLSPEMAEFHRSVIKMKDVLAGYTTMVSRRHMLTGFEIEHLFKISAFRKIRLVKDILYRFDTRKRLETEFRGNKECFEEWHAFIRESVRNLDPSLLQKVHYKDDGDRISFDVRKVIGLAVKPISVAEPNLGSLQIRK